MVKLTFCLCHCITVLCRLIELISTIEKSDKTKNKNFIFVILLMLTSYIIMSSMFGRLDVGQPGAILWGSKAFIALSQISWISNLNLSDWSRCVFDQRCSFNLIMRRVTRLKPIISPFVFSSLLTSYIIISWCLIDSSSSIGDVVIWRNNSSFFFGVLPNILNLKP